MRTAALILCCFIALRPCSAAAQDPPFSLPPPDQLKRLRSAAIYTEKGEIILELFPELAPWHVANLKYLADKGFYRDLKIHIYEPGYIIQTGAPGEKLNGGPGYTLPPEFNEMKHVAGIVSMVRKPDMLDQDHQRRSHGSQFRIFMRDNYAMDGQYTVFGRVIKGMDVVERLRLGDKVRDVKVFVRK